MEWTGQKERSRGGDEVVEGGNNAPAPATADLQTYHRIALSWHEAEEATATSRPITYLTANITKSC